MANPTTNFGWQMPQNTDLVKDLPADFEVFGQAVDTDLADLKGGAQNYILSKASATDLDFTWVAGIPLTINNQTGTTYTFVLSDGFNLVTANNASGQTYTIPPNSSVAYATGTVLNFIQIGTGQVTISQGSGVTISSTGATPTAPKLRVRYSAASAIKVATDTWYVVGDIA